MWGSPEHLLHGGISDFRFKIPEWKIQLGNQRFDKKKICAFWRPIPTGNSESANIRQRGRKKLHCNVYLLLSNSPYISKSIQEKLWHGHCFPRGCGGNLKPIRGHK
jgi:hypothetical protein